MKQGPLKHSKEDKEKHIYYVNIGYAIQTLREEFRISSIGSSFSTSTGLNSISYSMIVCFGLIIRLVSERMIENLRKFPFLTCLVLIYAPDYF